MPNLSNDLFDYIVAGKKLELDAIHTHLGRRGHKITPTNVVDLMVDISRTYKHIYEAMQHVQGLTFTQRLDILIRPLIPKPSMYHLLTDLGEGSYQYWPRFTRHREHCITIYQGLDHIDSNASMESLYKILAALQGMKVDPTIQHAFLNLFGVKHYPVKGSLTLCETTEEGALTLSHAGSITCI